VTEPQVQPRLTRPPGAAPWTDSHFWILQLVILALVLARLAFTVAFHLDTSSLVVEFSTLVLFVLPVAYASLSFGLPGAAVTAGWVTVLAIPRLAVAVSQHDPTAAWSEILQVVLLDGLALLIGTRVSTEREARGLADAAQAARLDAETLYRELFDSNQSPILIVDANGLVIEGNASALRAFGGIPPSGGSEQHQPSRLVDLIGADAASQVLTRLLSIDPERGASAGAQDDARVRPVAFEIDGRAVLYRPSATLVRPVDADRRMQVIFEDVTAETRRHDLMEAYAGQVVLAQEEERRHLAQEIHDGPLQALIHICRQIDLLEDTDGSAVIGPDGDQPLKSLRSTVEDTVAELRSIARGLRPSILDDLGLVASINQMLTEATARQQFESTFGVTGASRRLSPSVELALFRITQEAITNVERHAAASNVAVGIDFQVEGLHLLVKDDGTGFDQIQDPEAGGHSLGLPGMTERAHLIGATLVIHSQAGKGTAVDVWVPEDALRASSCG
jgi:signal transduction histidine kinase